MGQIARLGVSETRNEANRSQIEPIYTHASRPIWTSDGHACANDSNIGNQMRLKKQGSSDRIDCVTKCMLTVRTLPVTGTTIGTGDTWVRISRHSTCVCDP